jgi:hypothetical protein
MTEKVVTRQKEMMEQHKRDINSLQSVNNNPHLSDLTLKRIQRDRELRQYRRNQSKQQKKN